MAAEKQRDHLLERVKGLEEEKNNIERDLNLLHLVSRVPWCGVVLVWCGVVLVWCGVVWNNIERDLNLLHLVSRVPWCGVGWAGCRGVVW